MTQRSSTMTATSSVSSTQQGPRQQRKNRLVDYSNPSSYVDLSKLPRSGSLQLSLSRSNATISSSSSSSSSIRQRGMPRSNTSSSNLRNAVFRRTQQNLKTEQRRRQPQLNRRAPSPRPVRGLSPRRANCQSETYLRDNRDRLMKVLDQASSQLTAAAASTPATTPTSICNNANLNDSGITFCLKRSSLEESDGGKLLVDDSLTDLDGSNDSATSNGSSYDRKVGKDGSMKDSSLGSSGSNYSGMSMRRLRSSRGLSSVRSYHSLMESTGSTHSVFREPSFRRRKNHKKSPSVRRLKKSPSYGKDGSNVSLNRLTSNPSLNRTSLAAAYRPAMQRTPSSKKNFVWAAGEEKASTRGPAKPQVKERFHDGFSDLMKAPVETKPTPLRKNRSSRALLVNAAAETLPIKDDCKKGMRRQSSNPTLLPRQRSLKDLKADKEKAEARPSLSKQGSFTTKQSEIAALEAIIGTTRTSQKSLHRAKSFELRQDAVATNTAPLSPHPVSQAVASSSNKIHTDGSDTSTVRRTKSNNALPLSQHATKGDIITPSQRRRQMLLQTTKKSTSRRLLLGGSDNNHQRNKDELSVKSDHTKYYYGNPQPLSLKKSSSHHKLMMMGSSSSHGGISSIPRSNSRRGLMLRQGSFVAGSRMRTLRG